VRDAERRLSIGEAPAVFTGLPRLAKDLGLAELSLLRDAANPLGSAAARGFAVAVAAHAERGAASLSLASAGPSAAPLAAFARRHGLPCRVAIPSGASPGFRLESRLLKARVIAVLGDRGTATDWVRDHPGGELDRDLSAFSEPFRLEGAKTLALETWERHGEDLPGVVVVPTGSGLALAGLAKGFDELRAAGCLHASSPRLVAAQAEGCAPIARAMAEGSEDATPWKSSRRTLAEALRDPRPAGARVVLRALRATGGEACTVAEAELVEAVRRVARLDGVLVGPEAAVALAAVARLREAGQLADSRVLCLDPTALRRSPETLEAAGAG
jgi:threonine synthase